MATYAGDVFALSYNAHVMTPYVTKFGGLQLDTPTEDITPFGVTARAYGAIVLIGGKAVTVSGIYDDTATNGPDAVFGTAGLGTSATLLITWGGSKTTSVAAINVGYKRMPVVGKKTEYESSLQPSGTFTEV